MLRFSQFFTSAGIPDIRICLVAISPDISLVQESARLTGIYICKQGTLNGGRSRTKEELLDIERQYAEAMEAIKERLGQLQFYE